MNRNDLLTPEGTKDLLFEECMARREVENKFINIFSGLGYSEVVTPGIEFYDLFNKGARCFPQETLYKLVDSKGRLIAIRPDSTIPIARLAATRLKDAQLPLRLFYNQSIFTTNQMLKGRSDEIVQAGIELIGSDSSKADLEVLCIAIKSLSLYNNNFRLEIGHIGLFKQLVSELDADENTVEMIRRYIEAKNYPALDVLLDTLGKSKSADALRQLPRLFGGKEVFDKASKLFDDKNIDDILDNLREVYQSLSSIGYNGKITVDLGIVNRTDYYTGIVFKGYLEGYGEVILSGGRYDKLISEFGYDLPATGFGINVDAVAAVLRKSGIRFEKEPPKYLVYADKGYELKGIMFSDKLSKDGVVCENSVSETFSEAKKYALAKGIKNIVIVNENERIISSESGENNV